MENIIKELKKLYLTREKLNLQIRQLEDKLKSQKDFSKDEKISIFYSLFIVNSDIYAKKIVHKDEVKDYFNVVKDENLKNYQPITNNIIEKHLRGLEHIATYPISNSSSSKYLVIQVVLNDIENIKLVLEKVNLKVYYERNYNDNINIWIFFDEDISSKIVFLLGQKILKQSSINGTIFPNQISFNEDNLGFCLPLPLNLKYRNNNKNIFIDIKTMKPIDNQWLFLSNIKKNSIYTINNILNIENKNNINITNNIKSIVEIFIYDMIYIKKEFLLSYTIQILKKLSIFDNPQIKTLLSLRKPIYNTPKQIITYEEDDKYLKLPRGLINNIIEILKEQQILYNLENRTIYNKESFYKLSYTLRLEQIDAINNIVKNDFSICVAPPGFGKTLIGAKMISIRESNTLVIVNKNMLLDQWIDRFVDYFKISKKDIGYLGKSKNKLNSKLDVATMQSLKNNQKIIKNYSFVIVDECHHIPAITFELIIKQFKGRYILGLSATPNRKDGLQPILFHQLGQIAYEYKKKRTITHNIKLIKTEFKSEGDNYTDILSDLINDKTRNELIIQEVIKNSHKKILLLTDRIEHINNLSILFDQYNIKYITVYGGMNKKTKEKNMLEIEKSDLILASTSFFGEGIDFPHLNTIIFATPISYHGRLIQYLGRIGRNNQKCLAIDFLDTSNAMLYSSYKKRKEGYKTMHYKLMSY